MRDEIKKKFVITVFGAAFGYFVLSPFAMYMSHAVHMKMPAHETGISHVFRPELLQWSLPFAAFGGVVGVIIGTMYIRRKKAEDKLKKYTIELEESNRLRGIFTDVLRHDLLNLVGIIKNIVEIMEDDEKTERSQEMAVIKRNIEKLEDMIQNASQYAKLESSEGLEKKRLKLTDIISSLIEDVSMYAEEKKISIDFAPEDAYEIKANSAIESVFLNLLTNAIKYSPEETNVKIAVNSEGENMLISVADQGEGVPDKFKEAIFDRFTRKDKAGVRGSGLGLAITKRIVKLHDGRVWVEDNPEGGSIFKIELPKNNVDKGDEGK